MHCKPARTSPSLSSIVFISLAVLWSSLVTAQSLSGESIQSWVSSQKALEKWGSQHEETLRAYEDDSEMQDNPFAVNSDDMLRPLKKSGLYDDAEKIAQEHGFDSLKDWADMTLKITKTAAAIEMEKHPEMMDVSNLKTLLDSPQIPPEQKEMLKKAMEHNLAIMKDIQNNVTAADKKAVRPYLSQIIKLMNVDDNGR